MKIKFTDSFKKEVAKDPNNWKDPETILADKLHEVPVELKVNGLLYGVGTEVEFVETASTEGNNDQ